MVDAATELVDVVGVGWEVVGISELLLLASPSFTMVQSSSLDRVGDGSCKQIIKIDRYDIYIHILGPIRNPTPLDFHKPVTSLFYKGYRVLVLTQPLTPF